MHLSEMRALLSAWFLSTTVTQLSDLDIESLKILDEIKVTKGIKYKNRPKTAGKQISTLIDTLDPAHNCYVSRNVLDFGLWATIANTVNELKRIYTTYIMDLGGRTISDRTLFKKLQSIDENCLLGESNSDQRIYLVAKSLIHAMIDIYPVKFLWKSSGFGFDDKLQWNFITSRYTEERPETWGSIDSLTVVSETLKVLDSRNPFGEDISHLYKIFYPKHSLSSDCGPSRRWEVSNNPLYDNVIITIASCLTTENSP